MRNAIAVREDIRDLILDAAGTLLARFGYAKMTMDDVAREVGVAKGTLYLHFPSKKEVVLSRLDRMVERLGAELERIAASDLDAAAKLRQMLLTRVLYRFDYAKPYATSMDEMLASIRADLYARREKHFAIEARALAAVVSEGFPVVDAGATARAMLLATNALLPGSLTVKQLGRRDVVEERVTHIAALLIDGLRFRARRTK
ncbi:MAG TPA: helix-turn-helix domain-containing protein [Thermoanaerobaculia bacterium]|nr:helix-turn-helix domain-containing protein [Thermoanaerobaculia bacterium]